MSRSSQYGSMRIVSDAKNDILWNVYYTVNANKDMKKKLIKNFYDTDYDNMSVFSEPEKCLLVPNFCPELLT